jgi:hypothetical protein
MLRIATCIPEGPKATIYSTCTGVKYAGNTLTIKETTIYKYSSNTLNNRETNEKYSSDVYDDIKILGFHPYKEIVFLSASVETGLAYHLNGSKMESLGNIYPKEYAHFKELPNKQEMLESFPYTPCWIEEFPLNS